MDDLKKYTLLIVDDEATLREAIVFDFKRKGFTVLSTDNGTKAFEIVTTNKIHLVLSDIRMPDGDGITLLEKIKAYNPTTPVVIFVTGFTDITDADCIVKGALKVILKPFDRKVLMNCVLDALGLPIAPKAI